MSQYKIYFKDDTLKNHNSNLPAGESTILNGGAITVDPGADLVLSNTLLKSIVESVSGFFNGILGGFSWVGHNWQLLVIGVVALFILFRK